MPVVVADTGPLHYLVLIDAITLLPQLYGTVLVPEIVCAELRHPNAPASIPAWLATRPAWPQQQPTPPASTLRFPRLGDGERAAIALAQSVGAALVLTDDRATAAIVRAQGLQATGTLGVLELGTMADLIDLPPALKTTNFRHRPQLLEALLARHRERSVGA